SDGLIEPFDAVIRSIVLDPHREDFVIGQTAITVAKTRENSVLVRSFKRRFDKQRLRQQVYRHTFAATRDYDPVKQTMKVNEVMERVPIYYDEYSRAEVVAAGGRILNHLLTRQDVAGGDTRAGIVEPATVASIASESAEALYVGLPVSFGP